MKALEADIRHGDVIYQEQIIFNKFASVAGMQSGRLKAVVLEPC